MSKKIISLVLFAAMLLSATVANAVALEEKPTAVDYVTVANLGPNDTFTSTMTPPGGNVGVMVPRLSKRDKITITSSLAILNRKEYDVAIAFNGVLDTADNMDQVFINGDWVDLADATVYGTTENGDSVIYTKSVVDKDKYAPRTTYDKTYQLKVYKDNGSNPPVIFDYEFTIEFVDTKATDGWLNENILIENLVPGAAAAPSLTDPQQYDGKITWVAATDPDPVAVPAAPALIGNAVVNVYPTARLNVRAAASASSAIIGKLPAGTIVNVLAYSPTWSMIGTADGAVIGYVYSQYINLVI